MHDVTPTGKHRFNPFSRLLDMLDRLVSARADAEARRRGHTVTRVPGTRTHLYHDPRWSQRRDSMLDLGISDEPQELGVSAGEQP